MLDFALLTCSILTVFTPASETKIKAKRYSKSDGFDAVFESLFTFALALVLPPGHPTRDL